MTMLLIYSVAMGLCSWNSLDAGLCEYKLFAVTIQLWLVYFHSAVIQKNISLITYVLSSAGCTLCDKAYPSDCPDHGPVTFVSDTPIESRARLSVPKQLVIRHSIMGAEAGKDLVNYRFS